MVLPLLSVLLLLLLAPGFVGTALPLFGELSTCGELLSVTPCSGAVTSSCPPLGGCAGAPGVSSAVRGASRVHANSTETPTTSEPQRMPELEQGSCRALPAPECAKWWTKCVIAGE